MVSCIALASMSIVITPTNAMGTVAGYGSVASSFRPRIHCTYQIPGSPRALSDRHRLVRDVALTARHLVGREEELAAIVRLLDAAEQLPCVAVLPGEAGIGKTTLWLAGIDAAAARGYRIMSCRPSEAETRFAFAGLADLPGDAAGDALPELPPVQRRAPAGAFWLWGWGGSAASPGGRPPFPWARW